MHRTNLKSVVAVLVVLVTAMTVLMPGLSTKRVNASRIEASPGLLSKGSPVYFEENRGQQDGRVRYFSRGAGMEMFLTATEAVYVVRESRSGSADDESKPNEVKRAIHHLRPAIKQSKAVAVYMRLAGANAAAKFVPSEQLGHRTNYFKGNESEWRTGIPNFERVMAENIYDGVSMVWKGKEQGGIQYDFVVAPDADPSQIEWEIEGATNVSLDPQGGLVIETEAGVMRQSKPFTFQETDGEKSVVSSQWSVVRNLGKGGVQKFSAKYTLGEYDRSKTLTIDPLAYSTFVGGSGFDGGEKIVVDGSGNAYLTGATFSTTFPTTPGVLDTTYNTGGDAYVAKLNAAGSTLVYSTYLGGSSSDSGRAIAVDASGNAFVTGTTESAGFPTTAGAFDTTHNGGVDAFAAKLNSTGTALLYSTFVGGGGFDFGFNLAVDAAGNAFVAGTSESPTFPTTAGAFDTTHNGLNDAFVTKLDPAGSALVYSTFIGGSSDEECYGLSVDPTGNAFVTGDTNGATYPTTAGAFDTTFNGSFDAYVTKLNPAGSALVYSTFIGGDLNDGGFGLATDSAGNAYVTGYTLGGSTAFPTTAGAFDTTHNGSVDAFVTKLNSTGNSLVYSTFLGGLATDDGRSIAVDTSGNAILTGITTSPTFPTTVGAYDTTHNGDFDAFVTKLNPAGTVLVDSTFIGGSSRDVGLGLALDSAGNALVTGDTDGAGFPTTAGAFDTTHNGDTDAFVTKLDFGAAGLEADVSPRPNGDGTLLSTDLVQIRRFVSGLDIAASSPNEFQRADCSPRSTLGDGALTATDLVQVRRYVSGLDPVTNAGGPTVAADPGLRSVIGGSFGERVDGLNVLQLASTKGGTVVVELEGPHEVAAVSFKVRYDATRFGKPVVSLGDLADGAVLTVNDTVEGELTILIDSAGPLGAVGEVLRLVELSFEDGSAGGSAVLDSAVSGSDLFGNDVVVGARMPSSDLHLARVR